MIYYLNNKAVCDIEVSGVDSRDYPDFTDSYLSAATWADDGGDLSSDDLEALQEAYPELAAELAFESLI